MKQQNEPSVPPSPEVIYFIQAPKEKVNLKDAYNSKAATALGVVHIVCGLIALGADITGMVNGDLPLATGTGIWTSVFFFVSGAVGIGGAQSGNKFLVMATLETAIINAVFAGILLIMSAISLVQFQELTSFNYRYMDERSPLMSEVQLSARKTWVLIAMSATMLVTAIVSASLACSPLCCRSTRQATFHYNPKQVHATKKTKTTPNRCTPPPTKTTKTTPSRLQRSTYQHFKTKRPTI